MSATTGVSINWRRNSNNGAAISNYVLQYSANYGASWITVDTESIARTATIGNLPAGLPYLFRVAAINRVGPSSYSVPGFATKPSKINFSATANDVAAFSAETDFVPQSVPGWPSGAYTPIPGMTSNTTPSGVASGASNTGYNYLFDSTNAWRVFADIPETSYSPSYRWITTINKDAENNFSAHIQYEFSAPNLIGGYRLQSIKGPDSYNCPKSWTFLGSNDGVNFDVLDTQTLTGNEAFRATPGSLFDATLATPVVYKIYRWVFTRNFDINTSLTGINSAQVLPPSNALTYQWQFWRADKWNSFSRQTHNTLKVTPNWYSTAIGESAYGQIRLRCLVGAPGCATIPTKETQWVLISLADFSGYIYSDNYWTSGNVTENGVSYSVMNMDTAEPVYFNLENWNGGDISWFTGNNWTLTLQKSTDGVNWIEHYSVSQRAEYPGAYVQVSPPTGTSYWRWFVRHNWPLTATNGLQCAEKEAPTAFVAHFKIIVAT